MPVETSFEEAETLASRVLREVPLFDEDDEAPKYLPHCLLCEIDSLSPGKKRELIANLWAYGAGSITVYNYFFNRLRCPEARFEHKDKR